MAVYKYQVWSTVLGQAVAVMDNAGNQVENRVYMGGTLLATSWGRHTTGTSADDAITFHAKDPVTETEVNYAYNANGSTFASNETEPFGQNISNIDPYIQEWNNYAQVQNGAQDPEWQCTLFEKMNGGFGDMPVHCQKAAMQENYFGYDNKFWKGKAEDLTSIAKADAHKGSHGSRAEASPSDAVVIETATATKKSEKGGPSVSTEDGCDPDKPITCNVTKQIGDDPLDEISAENGIPLDMKANRLTLNYIANKVMDLLTNNANCNAAVSTKNRDALTTLNGMKPQSLSEDRGFVNAGNQAPVNANGDEYIAYTYPPGVVNGFTVGRIDFYKAFFSNFDAKMGSGNVSDKLADITERRMLLMLHEIGHATWKWAHPEEIHEWLRSHASVVIEKQWDNATVNQHIYDNCFKK